MKSALAGLAAAALALGAAVPAATAHVTIDNEHGHPGEFLLLRFHATNDGTSPVVRVEIDLPDNVDFAVVTPRADDWAVTLDHRPAAQPIETEQGRLTEVIDKVVYSDSRTDPGRLEIFDLEIGPLPAAGQRLLFRATQTFEDGTVARWDQPVVDGVPEPARAAPYLDIIPEPGPPGRDDWYGLDIVAIVLGGIAIVIGSTAIWRTRRRV